MWANWYPWPSWAKPGALLRGKGKRAGSTAVVTHVDVICCMQIDGSPEHCYVAGMGDVVTAEWEPMN